MPPPRSPREGGGQERFEPEILGELPEELAFSRLPVGRHGLPRSFVARNQRLRILAAMLRLLPRLGYAKTTVGQLTREAGVSRAAFYTHFAGKEECFLATYELAGEWLCERVAAAAGVEDEWPAGVRAGIAEMLRLLAADPPLARLIVVEAQQAGPAARERQRACLTRFAEALRTGSPRDRELPPELEELLLGGVLFTIAGYVEGDRTELLPDLTPQLVEYLLSPYLSPRLPLAATRPGPRGRRGRAA
jgi:AcrR family transcriptional regulator